MSRLRPGQAWDIHSLMQAPCPCRKVGVTERANSFAALRSLARQTTGAQAGSMEGQSAGARCPLICSRLLSRGGEPMLGKAILSGHRSCHCKAHSVRLTLAHHACIAELWSERREEQGHPLGNALLDCKASTVVDLGQTPAHSPPTGPAPFLLEIGCEELPPADLQHALTQLRCSFKEGGDRGGRCGNSRVVWLIWQHVPNIVLIYSASQSHRQGIPQLLKACRLSHGAVTVAGTPRRLVVNIADLAPQQSAASERIRGPPAKVGAHFCGKGLCLYRQAKIR